MTDPGRGKSGDAELRGLNSIVDTDQANPHSRRLAVAGMLRDRDGARGKCISEGASADGRRIEVYEAQEGGYWERFTVLVNGQQVEITDRPSRRRDGGTTTIPTSAGVIHLPRKLGREPGPDTIDGEPYAYR